MASLGLDAIVENNPETPEGKEREPAGEERVECALQPEVPAGEVGSKIEDAQEESTDQTFGPATSI